MKSVGDLVTFIEQFAPSDLAEDWDNVGLLVGDPNRPLKNIMTCLTITPESASEAISKHVDAIVTHHPLPFRGLKRLTTLQTPSRLLLELIKADVAVISPHTAFDSTTGGINELLAEQFQLADVRPLVPSVKLGEQVGAARIGSTNPETKLADLLRLAKEAFQLPAIRFVGETEQSIDSVALCCGSGGSFLDKAIAAGCDALITGETTFHTCLEAKASGVSLLLLGHHNSERFAVEKLAELIAGQFDESAVWASELESDPVQVA